MSKQNDDMVREVCSHHNAQAMNTNGLLRTSLLYLRHADEAAYIATPEDLELLQRLQDQLEKTADSIRKMVRQ